MRIGCLHAHWLFLLSVAAPVVISCRDTANTEPKQERVVGGQPESGYPPVGYLLAGSSTATLNGPICGATLVGRNVAITAAHCVDFSRRSNFGIGLGTVGSGLANPAIRVFKHPKYDPDPYISRRYLHDVAVLILRDDVLDVTPAEIGSTEVGEKARYIGYGRVTPGNYFEREGYTKERKSAEQDITGVDALSIWTRGVDGGLCWGDSGGALVKAGTTTILGVLADFHGVFECQVGNAMIFTSLDGERDFIERAIACQTSEDPACILPPESLDAGVDTPDAITSTNTDANDGVDAGLGGDFGERVDGGHAIVDGGAGGDGSASGDADVTDATVVDGGSCQFFCDAWGYSPHECYDGWYCDGLCVTYTGCTP